MWCKSGHVPRGILFIYIYMCVCVCAYVASTHKHTHTHTHNQRHTHIFGSKLAYSTEWTASRMILLSVGPSPGRMASWFPHLAATERFNHQSDLLPRTPGGKERSPSPCLSVSLSRTLELSNSHTFKLSNSFLDNRRRRKRRRCCSAMPPRARTRSRCVPRGGCCRGGEGQMMQRAGCGVWGSGCRV